MLNRDKITYYFTLCNEAGLIKPCFVCVYYGSPTNFHLFFCIVLWYVFHIKLLYLLSYPTLIDWNSNYLCTASYSCVALPVLFKFNLLPWKKPTLRPAQTTSFIILPICAKTVLIYHSLPGKPLCFTYLNVDLFHIYGIVLWYLSRHFWHHPSTTVHCNFSSISSSQCSCQRALIGSAPPPPLSSTPRTYPCGCKATSQSQRLHCCTSVWCAPRRCCFLSIQLLVPLLLTKVFLFYDFCLCVLCFVICITFWMRTLDIILRECATVELVQVGRVAFGYLEYSEYPIHENPVHSCVGFYDSPRLGMYCSWTSGCHVLPSGGEKSNISTHYVMMYSTWEYG